MLAKRIIPCLDVKHGQVIKGMQFKNHKIVGDIIERANFYNQAGADEIVFYDIAASGEERVVDKEWIKEVAQCLDIPFCVAGGIASIQAAEEILNAGADKISLNTPALRKPNLINELVGAFGSQCVVIGIDSLQINGDYYVCQYTGHQEKSCVTLLLTEQWIHEVQDRGAGEIVLNCMNEDGIKNGYDIVQLQKMRKITRVPLIASGGAGSMQDFYEVFTDANADGALAASVFHYNLFTIASLKNFLAQQALEVRQ